MQQLPAVAMAEGNAGINIHNANEINVKVCNRTERFVVDTGADCNLISSKLYENLKFLSDVQNINNHNTL